MNGTNGRMKNQISKKKNSKNRLEEEESDSQSDGEH